MIIKNMILTFKLLAANHGILQKLPQGATPSSYFLSDLYLCMTVLKAHTAPGYEADNRQSFTGLTCTLFMVFRIFTLVVQD